MKTIICIVGKTGTGKDTIAKYLYNKYGIDAICSYTTREKRDYETDGKEHWFITKDKMDYIKNNEHMLGYTINDKTGIEYCATAESINDNYVVYIINPNGIKYMQKHLPEGFVLKYIYCELDENIILSSRNLDKVTLLEANEINVLDLIANEKVIITEEALKEIEEVLA